MSANVPPSTPSRPINRRRRAVTIGILVAVAAFLSWRPCNEGLLYRVLPDNADVVSSHRNLASEWHALARHPMLIECLQSAGVDEAADLADETGFYQTLFWLTGSKTTLALELPDGLRDSVGDLSSLASLASALSSDTLPLDGIRLSGASYVGWKRRPMELLWRIRYVPGLGPLDVTDSGTRYLVFRHSKTMRRLGLVLSLDMKDGHLLAVLSQDPDAVTSLVARAEAPATGLVQSFPRGPRHIFRAKDFGIPSMDLPGDTPPAWTLSIDTFRDPHRLVLHVTRGDQAAPVDWRGKDVPPTGAGTPPFLALVNFPVDILPGAAPESPPTGQTATALLYGSAYPSTLCGFPVPGLVAFLPPTLPNPRGRLLAALDESFSPGEKRPSPEDAGNGVTILNLRPLFGKHAIIKPDREESPFLLVPTSDSPADAPAVLGSCLASYRRLSAMPDAVAPAMRESAKRMRACEEMPPEERWDAVGWIDLAATAGELRNAVSLASLVSSFIPDAAPSRSTIAELPHVLEAAAALGTLDFAYREPFLLEAVFTREP